MGDLLEEEQPEPEKVCDGDALTLPLAEELTFAVHVIALVALIKEVNVFKVLPDN